MKPGGILEIQIPGVKSCGRENWSRHNYKHVLYSLLQDLRQERRWNDRFQGVLVRTERDITGETGAETQVGLFHV